MLMAFLCIPLALHYFCKRKIKKESMQEEIISRAATQAMQLLEGMIARPSFSREETAVADFIEDFMQKCQLNPQRAGNNLWCVSPTMKSERPTLLLNAHLDTVKPAAGWKHDPFTPTYEGDSLYGLGSNDCGGGLVSLLMAFMLLRCDENLPYNLIFLASAEEEVSGKGGIESVLPLLPHIDVAIVGEPTGMQPAIAEKGLMVLDVVARGKAGHAARNEGVNAIYAALADIEWFRSHHFEKISPLLGEVKMTVTVIQAGTQHNVVPAECRFTVDVRSNECYQNTELLDEIVRNVKSEVVARSTRLNSSGISLEHPLVQRAVAMGKKPFASPTLSDQALMPFPSFKMGPGDSARSHTADEYIRRQEVEDAIRCYCSLLGS